MRYFILLTILSGLLGAIITPVFGFTLQDPQWWYIDIPGVIMISYLLEPLRGRYE